MEHNHQEILTDPGGEPVPTAGGKVIKDLVLLGPVVIVSFMLFLMLSEDCGIYLSFSSRPGEF